MAQIDYTQYSNQLTKTTRSLLRTARASSDIAGKVHLLTVAVERDLAGLVNAKARRHIACRAGCGTCCQMNVDVLLPEAITITWYLRRHLAVEQRIDLLERLAELHGLTAWLDDEERLYLREPCAFLDASGRCMIHQVRPLRCRSITSLDAETCRNAVAMVPLEGMPVVTMNLAQKNLMDAAFNGMSKALAELGLDGRPWRLTTAMHWLFSEPTAVNRFLAGEQVTLH